ncbi:MAG: nucleoside hydrolase [Bacteroidales bacterium]|nr:nucleoside hydrolase [Bacteroidales bacterium]
MSAGICGCIFASCGNGNATSADDATTPMKVIFETDMGNDVDDALALDMLFKYVEQGDIELLGISSNKRDEGSMEYLDILTTWYGQPDIPLGYVENGVPCEDAVNYANAVYSMKASDGTPLFGRSHASDSHMQPSVTMYRSLLAQQPDSSVTIISVGFSTNLAQLLASGPDAASPLTGKDLVARKVARLVTMAGDMAHPGVGEYNVIRDIDAARKVFAEWPTPVVTSPHEVGAAIEYPASSIENDFNWTDAHPVVEAYKAYLPMPYDRPTWDLTSVLYAVEGDGDYFTVSEPGEILVDSIGATSFRPSADGNRRYLTVDSGRAARVLDRFLTLIPRRPQAYGK